MSALYSTTLNRTHVGLRRQVHVCRCHDSAPLTPPPIALPPKPPALLNSSRRPSRLSPSRSKSQRRLQLTAAASLKPCMKLTPTLSSPRRCCSYYDVVITSVISLSSLYWPLPSPCCNPIYHTCFVSYVKLHRPSSIYHVWMQEDGVPCR